MANKFKIGSSKWHTISIPGEDEDGNEIVQQFEVRLKNSKGWKDMKNLEYAKKRVIEKENLPLNYDDFGSIDIKGFHMNEATLIYVANDIWAEWRGVEFYDENDELMSNTSDNRLKILEDNKDITEQIFTLFYKTNLKDSVDTLPSFVEDELEKK